MKNRMDLFKRKLNDEAVSQTISFLLVMMVFFSATGAILIWSPGYIENEENKKIVDGMASSYKTLSSPILDSAAIGSGSIYSGELVITEGKLEIDSEGERLIVAYAVDPDWGFTIEDGLDYDDTNGELVIKMDDPSLDIDEVVIYRLEDTCFLAGTKIKMANGLSKNIEEIKSGDLVKSYDPDSKKFTNVKVRKLLKYNADIMGEYYLEVNNKLRVTPNHKIMINNNWIKADEISVGDVGLNEYAGDLYIKSVEKKYIKETSYDLQLESGSVYFADGFMVRSDFKPIMVSDYISKMSSTPVTLDSLGGGSLPGGTPCSVSSWAGNGRTIYADKDARLNEDTPETPYGTTGSLVIDGTKSIFNLLWERERSIIHFPLSNIPSNAVINNANIKLYYYNYFANEPEGLAVQLHEIPDELSNGQDIIWPEDKATWRHWNEDTDKLWDGECVCGIFDYPFCSVAGDLCTEVYHYRTPKSTYKIVDSLILPDDFAWVTFDGIPDCDESHGVCYGDYYGLTNSVQELVDGTRVNNGWVLSGQEVWGGTHEAAAFYSKDEGVAGDYRPKIVVWYVQSPTVNIYDVSNQNIGEDWVLLSSCFSDGLVYSDANAHNFGTNLQIGISESGIGEDYVIYYNAQEWSGTVGYNCTGLTPGNLYNGAFWASNGAGSDFSSNTFFTVPPEPASFNAQRVNDNLIQCSWTKATCGSGAIVYTRVLARTDQYPTGPNDGNAAVWYYGEGTSCSQSVSPSESYYIRAWTYAKESAPIYPPVYYGRYSNDYKSRYLPDVVHDDPPIAYFVWVDHDLDGDGRLIDFDASGSRDDNGIVTYAWDWDYIVAKDFIPDETTNQPLTSHEYPDYEIHNCALRVYDAIGQWDQYEDKVFADSGEDEFPYACFEYGDLDGEEGSGTEFWFDADCSSDDGSIANYSWDFLNDNTFDAWDENVTFDNGNTDIYEVRLRVRDNSGQESYLTREIAPGGPPSVPAYFEVNLDGTWFDLPDDSLKFYTSTSENPYQFSCMSTDSDKYIYYEFDWGDGSSNWYNFTPGFLIREQPSADAVAHSWQYSGVYDIKVRALNDKNVDGDNNPLTNYSYASDWSEPIAIRVYYKYVVPPDSVGAPMIYNGGDIVEGPAGTFTVSTGTDLSTMGAFCIYIKSNTYPTIGNTDDKGKVPPGYIYVFNMGKITHRPSYGDAYKTILQNGGVLSIISNDINVRSYSNFIESGDNIAFYVTMIRGDRVVGAEGAGNYRLTFKNINTLMRQQQDYKIYDFKVKFSGEYASYWHKYLDMNYLFSSASNGFSLYDAGNGKQLVFLSTLFRTNIG